jgi:putative transposase
VRTTAIIRMARLLQASTSGYYKCAKRSVTTVLADRQRRKADLTVKIMEPDPVRRTVLVWQLSIA